MKLFTLVWILVAAAADAATLSETPTSVPAGGSSVTATWSGISTPTTTDWIGLYTPGAPDNPRSAWRYTTGAASGSVPFNIPANLAPGTYQLRHFAAGSWTLLATSSNFTVNPLVTGTVTQSGSPVAGVSLAATNGGTCTSSNVSGQYTCNVPPGWSGSVTPSPSAYTFAPVSRSYSNVTAIQSGQNYVATPFFQLTGTVTFGGSPLSGVTLAATNGVNCTTSNASGQYSCSGPQGWSGTVTPALNGYDFSPTSREYTGVTANQSAQNYAASTEQYQIIGTVRVNGVPLANAGLTATNGGICTSSNAWGQYSCTVAQGWSGSVTPSASGYSFAPGSRDHSGVVADQIGQDFTATFVSASAPMFFIHVDHLNTPRVVANGAGTTVWSWDQDEPFGSNVANENPSGLGTFELPLRLPGQYFDKETNLHYNYFRTYQPGLGRYGESDPIGLAGGLNTYSYVASNPTRFADRLGLFITTVDAYCALRPAECAEVVGDIIENASGIVNQCVSDEARQAADWIRRFGEATTYIAAGAAASKLPRLLGGGTIPWSSSGVGKAAKDLRGGATDVQVASKSQAEELFLRLYQGAGYRNTTGMTAKETKDFFGGKAGTYHWDIGAAKHPHEMSHLQIHTLGGDVVRIGFPR
jgi:RHS repeat-associated protein